MLEILNAFVAIGVTPLEIVSCNVASEAESKSALQYLVQQFQRADTRCNVHIVRNIACNVAPYVGVFIFGNLFANILETKEHSKYVRGGAGEGFWEGLQLLPVCESCPQPKLTYRSMEIEQPAKHLGFLCAYQC